MELMETRQQYQEMKSRGIEPLLKNFVSPALRRELQREIFGHTNIPRANERFYRWVWERKPHVCEECGRPLNIYSAMYVSHILSRGAHPEMSHDPRNVNILCFRCHERWENGSRKTMRIYEKNCEIIEQLRKDYEG